MKDKIIEILIKHEVKIDDSDYHDVAIFSCDYAQIVAEILAALEQESKETEIIKALSGEKIEDIATVTSTEYPIEPKEVNTAEEKVHPHSEQILNKLYLQLERNAYNAEYHNYHFKEANQTIRKWFYGECASKQSVQMPTDEEIIEWAKNVDIVLELNDPFIKTEDDLCSLQWLIFGAKWFREQAKPIDKEEELVKFVQWYKNEYGSQELQIEDIKEYLSQK